MDRTGMKNTVLNPGSIEKKKCDYIRWINLQLGIDFQGKKRN